MGDTLALFNPIATWYGEGDEKIWVDGESFPSHVGTGTEDYYGYSYAPQPIHNTPFCGEPRLDQPMTQGHSTSTRTRKLVLYATQAPDYATLQFRVNGQDVPAKFDGYAASVQPAGAFALGTYEPRESKFTLRAEVVGANPAAKGAKYFFGLDCVILEKP